MMGKKNEEEGGSNAENRHTQKDQLKAAMYEWLLYNDE